MENPLGAPQDGHFLPERACSSIGEIFSFGIKISILLAKVAWTWPGSKADPGGRPWGTTWGRCNPCDFCWFVLKIPSKWALDGGGALLFRLCACSRAKNAILHYLCAFPGNFGILLEFFVDCLKLPRFGSDFPLKPNLLSRHIHVLVIFLTLMFASAPPPGALWLGNVLCTTPKTWPLGKSRKLLVLPPPPPHNRSHLKILTPCETPSPQI